MQDFRNLKVWEKAHQLTLEIYRITKEFPKEELFGLTSQARRAASSIPANIAEGCCRKTNGDFGRFLQIALGSASELDYHLLLSRDLKLLNPTNYEPLWNAVTEVKRMLTALLQKVANS